jgi:hypothetical protein
MSLSYNLTGEAGTNSRLATPELSTRAGPRQKGGLLISPEASLAEKAEGSARSAVLWLGIALILSSFTLIISLISLALS